MSPEERILPKTFYLNEQHELSRGEKEPGGRIPQYADIDWTAKGGVINRSLKSVASQIQASHDPLKSSRYFVLAQPEGQLAKVSKDKTKAVDGKVYESTIFSEKHSRVFRRLGMDLIGVTQSGSAVVHMKPELLSQLENSSHSLAELGAREKSRWATINRFEMIPVEAKVDLEWIRSIGPKSVGDGVIELQPLLTRSETDSIIRAIVATLSRALGERAEGTGTDYSGRQWVRGKLTAESLERIARDFFSIQSLHSPLTSSVARSLPASPRQGVPKPSNFDIARLPVIGVLDTGVPSNHSILSKYQRGAYVAPTSSATATDPHGTFVSSRIVFGDPDYSGGPPIRTPEGQLRFYDMNISGLNPREIEGKSVLGALQAVVSTAPDVRVFNMSFDAEPLDLIGPVKRAESLALVQYLDNFIFQNDIIVVVAAGNSPPGMIPAQNYPQHFNDPAWALGPWARSFNSLTCGSYVGTLSPGGLAPEVGWPSPFCRVGPGLCDSPKPDFSANGGNSNSAYRFAPGLGVWGLSMGGLWEDSSGSSFAAPLLARECAFALDILQGVCDRGAQPFGATVKAFLALTSTTPKSHSALKDLVLRTLGRGTASVDRLVNPSVPT